MFRLWELLWRVTDSLYLRQNEYYRHFSFWWKFWSFELKLQHGLRYTKPFTTYVKSKYWFVILRELITIRLQQEKNFPPSIFITIWSGLRFLHLPQYSDLHSTFPSIPCRNKSLFYNSPSVDIDWKMFVFLFGESFQSNGCILGLIFVD